MKNINLFENFPGISILDRWKNITSGHEQVVRWGSYLASNYDLPRQTNLHHLCSVSSLFAYYGRLLWKHKQFDLELLLRAIIFHEDGEGIRRKDILFHDKTSDVDRAEYEAVCESVKHLSEEEQHVILTPFLLQFMTNVNVSSWGGCACHIMEYLKEHYEYEGKIFNAFERFDYVCYPASFCETQKENQDVVIMTHVLRNQTSKLDQYATEIEGFGKVVWTPEHSEWAHTIIEKFKDMPDSKNIPAAYTWARDYGFMLSTNEA